MKPPSEFPWENQKLIVAYTITKTHKISSMVRSTFLIAVFLLTGILSAGATTFTVTSLNDAGPGSLAEAINSANGSPGSDDIHFAVAGTINMNGQLPAIIDPVVIDGSTAPGYVACGAPVVALNFVGGGGAHGLLILAGGAGTTVRALNIRGFTAAGISSENSGGSITVQSCYIGTDITGTVAVPNNLGIFLLGSPDCVVGGDSCEGNVVAGNLANGIAMELGSHRAVVTGNYVGIGADGTTLLGNGLEGIYAFNSDSLKIGMAAPGMGNIVVGSGAQGIHLNGGGNGSSNALIYNNWVGTNGSDTTTFGNQFNGIFIEGGTSGTQIGGTGPFQANRIAHNGLNGIQIDSLNDRNLIVGNSIYCNADSGIFLYFANELIPILPNLSSSADSVSGTGAIPGNIVHAYRNLTVGDSGFCDCEGESYLGSGIVGASGEWSVVHSLGLNPAEQGSVTATQTDAQNNTSEFYQPCSGGVPVGVENILLSEKLRIYPNPNHGSFRIQIPASFEGEKQLRVYDGLGKLVHSRSLGLNTEVRIDAGKWIRGIYFLRVDAGEHTQIGKLLLQ
jgi:hypothetical protein